VIRTATILATALRGGGEPCSRAQLAGLDALVARPRSGSGPVVVYANAATPHGVDEPGVERLLGGLARAGFVAVAPELPSVRDGEVTPSTLDALVDVAGASRTGVTLIGASTGAGLAILAAGDPRIADRVSAVVAVAPYASLHALLRLATTGRYGSAPFDAAPLVATAAARSLTASAPHDPAVPVLLANRDPRRFDGLFAALEPSTRALVHDLSPITRISAVIAPVELLADPHDRFFPVDEARALARAGSDVRLTVTPALTHVVPRPRPGLVRVAGALDRALRHATAADRDAPVLRPSPAL
jgi:dienelactone hydrolase